MYCTMWIYLPLFTESIVLSTKQWCLLCLQIIEQKNADVQIWFSRDLFTPNIIVSVLLWEILINSLYYTLYIMIYMTLYYY